MGKHARRGWKTDKPSHKQEVFGAGFDTSIRSSSVPDEPGEGALLQSRIVCFPRWHNGGYLDIWVWNSCLKTDWLSLRCFPCTQRLNRVITPINWSKLLDSVGTTCPQRLSRWFSETDPGTFRGVAPCQFLPYLFYPCWYCSRIILRGEKINDFKEHYNGYLACFEREKGWVDTSWKRAIGFAYGDKMSWRTK